MNKRVGTEQSLIKDWIILIKETILLGEKKIFILKGQSKSYQKLWTIPLNCLDIDYKSSINAHVMILNLTTLLFFFFSFHYFLLYFFLLIILKNSIKRKNKSVFCCCSYSEIQWFSKTVETFKVHVVYRVTSL